MTIASEMGSTRLSKSGNSQFSQYVAATIRDDRDRQKVDLAALNDRLAYYIENVFYLEAHNRKLEMDLDELRNHWGQHSDVVVQTYEEEMAMSQRSISELSRKRMETEKEMKRLEIEVTSMKRSCKSAHGQRDADSESLRALINQLSQAEAEVSRMRRHIEVLEIEIGRLRTENYRMSEELKRARMAFEEERMIRARYQKEVEVLNREVEMAQAAHYQEVRSITSVTTVDTASDREYFKHELAAAICSIRAEYEQNMLSVRAHLDAEYKHKLQEIHTHSTHRMSESRVAEVKKVRYEYSEMRSQIAEFESRHLQLEKHLADLNYQYEDDQRTYEATLEERVTQIRRTREECEVLVVELQMLIDKKETIEAEIVHYRQMIEGRASSFGLSSVVEKITATRQSDDFGELTATTRMQYQRSAKGHVEIQEAKADGHAVVLHNTSGEDEALGEWQIRRIIDNSREIVYTFPQNYVLRAGRTVTIWARHQGGFHNPPDHLIFDAEDSFGVGSTVKTILYNRHGEERATYTLGTNLLSIS